MPDITITLTDEDAAAIKWNAQVAAEQDAPAWVAHAIEPERQSLLARYRAAANDAKLAAMNEAAGTATKAQIQADAAARMKT